MITVVMDSGVPRDTPARGRTLIHRGFTSNTDHLLRGRTFLGPEPVLHGSEGLHADSADYPLSS